MEGAQQTVNMKNIVIRSKRQRINVIHVNNGSGPRSFLVNPQEGKTKQKNWEPQKRTKRYTQPSPKVSGTKNEGFPEPYLVGG